MSFSSGAVSEFLDEIEPVIFAFGAVITLLFVGVFSLNPEGPYELVLGIRRQILATFNWFFLIAMLGFVLFLGFIILGPWGNLRLGDEDPEYGFLLYFTMMYFTGLAAGIVFWGPAEVLFHCSTVPPLYGAEAQPSAAVPLAVQYSIFHWSLTRWSCFTVMGLAISYFVYNYDALLRVSAVLTPILGADNVDGTIGKTIDILAVFTTLGGVATSLGFIGSQFITGLNFQWGIQLGDMGTILVITGMVVIFTISLVLGVDKGIQRLSNLNMAVFGLLMLATLIFGPTFRILELGTQATGGFVGDFFQMSLFTRAAATSASKWVNAWAVFYWLWPLAQSPFAGLFIAHISRGQSVREVAFAGVGATSLATVPWLAIAGGAGVIIQHTGAANVLGPVSKYGEAVSGYVLFGNLPIVGPLLLFAFLVLVTTFFVTSTDSSTLAASMMTTGGKEEPLVPNRIFWAILRGAIASILVVVGGVNVLQSATIITGTSFATICVIATLGLIRTFQQDYGSLLFQDETHLWGKSESTDGQAPVVNVFSHDDD